MSFKAQKTMTGQPGNEDILTMENFTRKFTRNLFSVEVSFFLSNL